jgi:hypothetical protein
MQLPGKRTEIARFLPTAAGEYSLKLPNSRRALAKRVLYVQRLLDSLWAILENPRKCPN